VASQHLADGMGGELLGFIQGSLSTETATRQGRVAS
jgi:hypothetical protein